MNISRSAVQNYDFLTLALLSHPLVVDCAVLPRRTASDLELIAYIVTSSSLSSEVLQNHIQSTLAGTSLPPISFVFVSHLPLTDDGALDEQKLLELAVIDSDEVVEQFSGLLQGNPDSEAIAVISSNEQLTYRELNQRTNQLAHYLRSLGVKPGMLVGIYMNRCLDMIIGIVGILKSGAAYVPLDPAYPKERLSLILEEAQTEVLLTQEHLAKHLPTSKSQIVNLDTDWDSIVGKSTTNLMFELGSQALAYIMYTSGSTGKPKGVQVTHANIHHYIQALGQEMQIQPGDVYLHTASFSFSSSVRQLIVPLALRATVVLATVEQLSDPLKLFHLIKTKGVKIIDFVPSYWRKCTEILLALEEDRRRNLLDNHLRLALSASEPLLSDIPKIWKSELKPGIRFVNMYGQTETTGIVATYSIPTTDEAEVKVVPIGKPIANTQILLLNEELVPVPDGEVGEIYIGGLSLAKGYLNRPDLTQERFINHPLNPDSNARLYKTGDLGRRLSNGTIAFAGRLDYQVKIRGKRVEIGEIETSLALHPAIKQTVVVGIQAPSGDTQLVAYIVPEVPSIEVNQREFIQELRSYLHKKLPDFMVPSFFIRLDAFPLTPNGKIDRKALPTTLEQFQEDLAATYIPPRNDLERELTEIWQTTLGIPQVGIQDNFFDLGGTSLTALTLFGQIETKFGKRLPLGILLERSTIESLAEVIQETTPQLETDAPERSPKQLLVKIQEGDPGKTPLFLVHALGVSVLYYRDFARYLGTDRPVYAIQPLELKDQSGIDTLEALAALYIKAIQVVQPQGPYLLGGHSFGGKVAFEMAQQLHHQGQDIAFLALFDTFGPNALTRLPFRKRILIHLHNFQKQGLSYLVDRIGAWYGYICGLVQTKYQRWIDSKVREQSESISYEILKRGIQDFHLDLSRRYSYRAYPGHIHLFRCVEYEPVNYYGFELDKENLGWDKVANGGLTICDVLGKHLMMFDEPYVQSLGEKVRTILSERW